MEKCPKGRILKTDVSIAKNYLSIKEIKKLERTISAYFDYIENQIENRKEQKRPFTMYELAQSVNKFLDFNDFRILDGKGKVSHQQAIEKAEKEYDIFNKTQAITSDFDEFVKNIKNK